MITAQKFTVTLIAFFIVVIACLPTITAASDAELKNAIDKDYSSHLKPLFEWFHSNPELSFQEQNTSARLAQELKQLGVEVTEGIGDTGLVGVIHNGPGPLILIRADMDALPILEDSGLPYSSTRRSSFNGKDVAVMHACGHDMHMTTLVGTAKQLMDTREQWSGTVMLVGQPAEEIGRGAKGMLDDGLYKKFGVPDYALGLHVWAGLPAGRIAVRNGIVTSSTDSVDIAVRGIGGHGAAPHLTKDPVYMASQLVIALQGIVSRQISPMMPAVITVGTIHGGTKRNIIPNEVELKLTVRTDSEAVRKQVLAAIESTALNIGRLNGLPDELFPVVTISQGTPTLVNNKNAVKKVLPVWTEHFGYDPLTTEPRDSMVGEDFSYYTKTEDKVPGIFFGVGGMAPELEKQVNAGKALPPSHHSPQFWIDPESIKAGVEAMYLAAIELLNNP